MVAITGIFHRNGRAVDRTVVQAMIDRLYQRGPAQRIIWAAEQAGLAQAQFARRNEAPQPFSHLVQEAGLVICADARLNNREEILAACHLPPRPVSALSDQQLILHAYQKWGPECPSYLLGDFAFAIWDSRKQKMFCARDHFGVRPFYYCLKNSFFAFASELKALLPLEEISSTINDKRIADYLALVTLDSTSTFYNDICRLSPGHTLVVSTSTLQIARYWQPDEDKGQPLLSDEEYAEAFQEIFSTAVRCRLTNSKSGILLSGGLDSSSVACVAERYSHHALPVYSGLFPLLKECDESTYIKAVLDQGNFSWQSLNADACNPFSVLADMASVQDEPWFAPHMFMQWYLFGLMRDQGMEVVLDGHDGDTTISYGFGHIHELIDGWHLPELLRETAGVARIHGNRAWLDMAKVFYQRHVLRPLKQSPVLGPASRYLKSRGHRKRVLNKEAWQGLFQSDFLIQCGVQERVAAFEAMSPTAWLPEKTRHQRSVFQPLQPYALEIQGRAAAAFAMEYRFPFWDKRLVEFCLNLPGRQKHYQGWSRSILRRGMQGILPPKIQWRPGKTDFTPNLARCFSGENRHQAAEQLDADLDLVKQWVNREKFDDNYLNKNTPQLDAALITDIWKVMTLAAWLRQQK